MSITFTSPAFSNNDPIPPKYTSDAQDVSPPLTWDHLPKETRSLALIMDDPDAPTADPWVHWVLYNIPPDLTVLPEGPSHSPKPIPRALPGKNSWNVLGYRGPQPPKGHGLHHYHFTLYALDSPLQLLPGLDKQSLLNAMTPHLLAQTELVGTYER